MCSHKNEDRFSIQTSLNGDECVDYYGVFDGHAGMFLFLFVVVVMNEVIISFPNFVQSTIPISYPSPPLPPVGCDVSEFCADRLHHYITQMMNQYEIKKKFPFAFSKEGGKGGDGMTKERRG